MEMDSVILRPLAENDASALAMFYNSLTPATIRTFRPLGDKTSLEVCQQIVNQNVIYPYKRFDLVSCQGTEIVGWAFLAILEGDHPDLGIVVAETLQGKGIGKALLTQLLGWASEQGLAQVYLMVVKDNQRAINLYQSHGFVTFDEEFDEVDQLPYFHMVAHLKAEASA
jgi:ribosomal protein S18 acetylase RimI-like enzyme